MSQPLNRYEIQTKLSFNEIMTYQVVYYDDYFKKNCADYCRERNITYLPSLENFNICYKFVDNEFQEVIIDESQKLSIDDTIFDESVVEKFKKHQVLFVFEKNELVGVVHFCDYNRNPVFIYIYQLLLAFEKQLRELLIMSGLGNEEMIKFLKNHQKNNEKMKELEPFQTFYLKDLIGLTNSKKILKISESVNVLRNVVMHAKNPVKHKDYEIADFIYNFESFNNFFQSVKLLQLELRKVTNKQLHPIQMSKQMAESDVK